ncbi:ABC-2 family transporter protein [Plantactinospora sp. S1510]|uniref:ABC-2 family transporter protein n=2 Tax=Plantactinospora alkalitolerans TaxID=2789879 RepID=A0ABS0H160_9ACTN|nr:ABC-2 family transporter protein [Plantactinospora alkalitolerans]
MRTARLYVRLLGAQLRAAAQYKADFLVMIFAAVLSQGVGLIFLAALFARVPHLDGWSFWLVALMYAMVTVAEGIGSLLFEGTWRLAAMVNSGELDYLLVRPYPVALQLMSSAVGFNGLGNLVLGTAMIVVALCYAPLQWSPLQGLILVLLAGSAVVVKLAMNLATNAASFWLQGRNPVVAYAMHQVGELARYPLGIYPVGLRVVLTTVVPFAFTSYYPVSYLADGVDATIGLLTPAVAVACVFIAIWVFRRGLRRYESAGS